MKIYDYILCSGSGNRFLLFDTLRSDLSGLNIAAFAAEELHRFGVDGLLLLTRDGRGRFGMRMFNTDGSEAEMCGNGIRCFAKYVYEQGVVKKTAFSVETLAGVMRPALLIEDGAVTGVRVDMGKPFLNCEEIPVEGTGRCIDRELTVNGQTLRFTSVLVGVPHTMIFVDDLTKADIAGLGSAVERAPIFPRRTNVNFVEVVDDHTVRSRTWERGCGRTLACGTGACSTAVACALTGRTGRSVDVQIELGTLHIDWAADDHVYMTGPAEVAFTGETTDIERA